VVLAGGEQLIDDVFAKCAGGLSSSKYMFSREKHMTMIVTYPDNGDILDTGHAEPEQWKFLSWDCLGYVEVC
jgi:hypothetical protein